MLVLMTSPLVSETFVAFAVDCECVLVVAETGAFSFVETCTLLPASSEGVVASLPTASTTFSAGFVACEPLSTIEMSVINWTRSVLVLVLGKALATDESAEVNNDFSPGKTAGRLMFKSVSLEVTTSTAEESMSAVLALVTEAAGATELIAELGNTMNNGSWTASDVTTLDSVLAGVDVESGADGSLIAESATEVGVVIFGVVCVAVSAKPVVVVSVVPATATNNASLVALCIISRLLYQSKTIISFLY